MARLLRTPIDAGARERGSASRPAALPPARGSPGADHEGRPHRARAACDSGRRAGFLEVAARGGGALVAGTERDAPAAAEAGPGRAAGLIAGLISGANVTGISVAKASLLFAGPLAARGSPRPSPPRWWAPRSWRRSSPGAAPCRPPWRGCRTCRPRRSWARSPPWAPCRRWAARSPVATAFAVVVCAGLASALALILVGGLGLGRVVRFFPHPVIAGFLASTGWVLLAGGVLMVAPGVTGAEGRLGWAPAALALLTGGVLAWATRRVPHSGVTLVVLALAGGAVLGGARRRAGLRGRRGPCGGAARPGLDGRRAGRVRPARPGAGRLGRGGWGGPGLRGGGASVPVRHAPQRGRARGRDGARGRRRPGTARDGARQPARPRRWARRPATPTSR